MAELTAVEICAGAGGQALGLEQAGFQHAAAIELDADACETLRRNRGDEWKIVEDDIASIDGRACAGVDLLAGGVPCPPFSIAGRPAVGATLADLMGARGWPGAAEWAAGASGIAPTIVGGSKRHGGPDLGPTRARAAWRELGVDGLGIADLPPGPEHPAGQPPKLTVRMVFPVNSTCRTCSGVTGAGSRA